MMRRLALHCAALALCLGPSAAPAQQFHVTGEVNYVGEHPRIAQMCPGCRLEAPASISISLSRPDAYGDHPLGGGTGNTLTATVAGQSWTVEEGSVTVLRDRRGGLSLEANAATRSGGPGSPRMFLRFNTGVPSARVGSVVTLAFDTCPGRPPNPYNGLNQGCQAGGASFRIKSASGGAQVAERPAPPSFVPSLVVFVGGLADNTAVGGMMRRLEARFESEIRRDPRGAQVRTVYFEYDDQPLIEREVLAFRRSHPNGAVALVGHSMGGHTAYLTARALQGRATIQLLATLDPYTRAGYREETPAYPGGRQRPRSPVPDTDRPTNVGRWINVVVNADGSGNFVCRNLAWVSSRWGQRREADHNVPLTTNHCAVELMFYREDREENRESCVQQSLQALFRGERVAGPCPRPAPAR